MFWVFHFVYISRNRPICNRWKSDSIILILTGCITVQMIFVHRWNYAHISLRIRFPRAHRKRTITFIKLISSPINTFTKQVEYLHCNFGISGLKNKLQLSITETFTNDLFHRLIIDNKRPWLLQKNICNLQAYHDDTPNITKWSQAPDLANHSTMLYACFAGETCEIWFRGGQESLRNGLRTWTADKWAPSRRNSKFECDFHCIVGRIELSTDISGLRFTPMRFRFGQQAPHSLTDSQTVWWPNRSGNYLKCPIGNSNQLLACNLTTLIKTLYKVNIL